MKRLNRYAKNCPLNKKLRKLYELKQEINNFYMLDTLSKREMLCSVDIQINQCWRSYYSNISGFEIVLDSKNCRRNFPVPISCSKKLNPYVEE